MTAGRIVVGVLGGTFDPVHSAHLAVAEHVRARTGLGRILFLPTAIPPHKRSRVQADADHRVAMLREALIGRDGLEICYLELVVGGICYSIDSLRRLRRRGLEPVLIIGDDSLTELPTWRDHTSLMGEFDLIVVDRARRDSAALAPEVASAVVDATSGDPDGWRIADLGRGGRIFRVPMSPVPISSSEIRSRRARGLDLGELVPPAVARYIQANRLYLQEESR